MGVLLERFRSWTLGRGSAGRGKRKTRHRASTFPLLGPRETDEPGIRTRYTCRRARSGELVIVRQRIRLVSTPADIMGAFLDKPKTEKTNHDGAGNGISYGIATMQGWRVDMEDAHTSIIGLGDTAPLKDWSFFAVFDGHAGSRVAAYSSTQLLPSILATSQMTEALRLLAESPEETPAVQQLIRDGIRDGFLHLDAAMLTLPEVYGDSERAGSTAIASLLTPCSVYVANLGDSRAVLSKADETSPFATDDHKPYLPRERERIEKAGGSVMIQRVNGSLAVSRAFGDYEYKNMPGLGQTEQQVSPEPDVYVVPREAGRDEFLLLACDGIYDVMTNTELSEFVRSRLRLTHDLPAIANQVLDACLSKGSRDNMSVVLITLPASPALCASAARLEAELHSHLETRIAGLVASSAEPETMEADFVIRQLLSQDIPGVPPGAGIHAVRTTVESLLAKAKGANGDTVDTDSSGSPHVSPAAS